VIYKVTVVGHWKSVTSKHSGRFEMAAFVDAADRRSALGAGHAHVELSASPEVLWERFTPTAAALVCFPQMQTAAFPLRV
jgi:hypothetical protein